MDGKTQYTVTKGYAFLLFSAVIFFAGMCTECIDRGGYIDSFNAVPVDFSKFQAYISTRKDSELFYGLQMVFKVLVSQNATAWMMLIALVQGLCLIKGFRGATPDIALSAYIFVASALSVSWMFNGIRQFIAVSILFANWRLLLTRKWWLFVLLNIFLGGITPICSALGLGRPVWFLCGVHQSAWIMVPIAVIIRGKAWNWRMFALTAALLIVVVAGALGGVLESAVENTTYADDLANAEADTNMNVMRFLVSLVPVVMSLIKKQQILSESTPRYIHLCVNGSIATAGLYFIASLTSGIYMGRLPIYTELLNLILLPWLIENCYPSSKKTLRIGVYVCYFLYFLYQMYAAWGGMYYCSEPLGIYLW